MCSTLSTGTAHMKVSDMDHELRDACIERGRALGDEITPQQAVEEWAGWHIGDLSWATTTIRLLDEARTDEKEIATSGSLP